MVVVTNFGMPPRPGYRRQANPASTPSHPIAMVGTPPFTAYRPSVADE
jgi:hypothetical protein